MQRSMPPYRADHVGSLLRPAALKEARAKHAKGELSKEALKQIEDREIQNAIRKQETAGLRSITDGEFRRSWWNLDFLAGFQGTEWVKLEQGVQFKGLITRSRRRACLRQTGLRGPPDGRPLQLPEGSHETDAENDDPKSQVRSTRAGDERW